MREIAAEWLGKEIGDLPGDVSYGLIEWNLEDVGGSDKDADGGSEAYQNLHRFAVTQRKLFKKLKPIDGAPVVLRRLAYVDKIRIRIITHRLFIPYFHRVAIAQTVKWLDKHGIPYWDLCLMREKAAVGADLYIEDSPMNIGALRAANKKVIAFGNSTNKDIAEPRAETWAEVEALVTAEVEAWKAEGGPAAAIAGH